MNETTVIQEINAASTPAQDPSSVTLPKSKWEAPRLEDVSEQVMAQPYIRFT